MHLLSPLCTLSLLPLISAKLIFVSVLWRHGDRAPGDLPYPLDVNDESKWPRGWNQLTNTGMEQSYELGEWLRKRYITDTPFISDVFNRTEVLVRSSDSERALTTAQCVTAALFLPEGESVWKSRFTWQPTPIHSNGEGRPDPLLKPTKYDCPRYEETVKEENRALLASMDKDNEALFLSLANNTGMPVVDSSNVDGLYDITREIAHSLPQPAWATDELVRQIAEFKRKTRIADFNSPNKSLLRGGYLVGDLLNRLKAAATNAPKALKTTLYSSHDGTLSAFSYAMGVGNDLLVPYAAAYITELHYINDTHTVQVLYRNDTAQPPYLLTVPGCTDHCPLDQFTKLLTPRSFESEAELDKACGNKSNKSSSAVISYSLLATLLTLAYSLC